MQFDGGGRGGLGAGTPSGVDRVAVTPGRHDQERRQLGDRRTDRCQIIQRIAIGPMHVLDDQQQRVLGGNRFEHSGQGLLPCAAPVLIRHRLEQALHRRRQRKVEQRADKRLALGWDQPHGLLAYLRLHPIDREQLAREHADDLAALARAEVQHECGVAREAELFGAVPCLAQEACLADAGIAAQQHDPASPCRLCLAQHGCQLLQLGCAPDEPAGIERRRGAETEQAVDPHRQGNALEHGQAAILELGRRGQPHPDRFRDQQLARPGEVGQPGGQVHGLPGNRVDPMRVAAGEARHHGPHGDADMDLQCAADAGG